jgi:hypothetical protein
MRHARFLSRLNALAKWFAQHAILRPRTTHGRFVIEVADIPPPRVFAAPLLAATPATYWLVGQGDKPCRGFSMRQMLIAAAIGGLFIAGSVQAQNYYQGGPRQIGKQCQVITDGDQRYGYVAPCPQPVSVTKVKKRAKK